MQSIQNLSLVRLRFGHEFPGASINARQAGRLDGIEQLAASIGEEGILNSLHAFQDPAAEKAGIYFIDDGNRRLAALHLLITQKKIAKDALIPTIVFSGENSQEALRKSAAAAAHAVPVHPVDQFEAFAAIIESEKATPEQIATRYALPLRAVKQRLALGKLSPVIRDAWRKGKLNAEAAEAYAATSHHGAQEKLWKRGTWEAKQAHQIRRLLIGDENELGKLLKFVGEPAYKEAGGKLVEDLFGEKEGKKFADFGLLQRLADEKVKAKCAEYVAAGWGWAALDDDLPGSHAWPRKSKPTAEEKKKLGVILDLTYSGALEVKTGVIKPGVKGVKGDNGASAGKAKPKKPEGAISDSLAQRLSEALSFGVSDAMATDKPELALALVLAAMNSGDGPISINETGLAEMKRDKFGRGHKPAKFKDQLPIFLKLSLKDKMEALAKIVGRAVDMQTQSAGRLPLANPENVAVIAKMDGKRLGAEIRARFDAADYFASVAGELRIKAIAEMAPAGTAEQAAKLKKGAQVDIAVAWFGKSKDWLPPELRTVHYAGPALDEPAKSVGKKKPAKKKAR